LRRERLQTPPEEHAFVRGPFTPEEEFHAKARRREKEVLVFPSSRLRAFA
jgi:hypothetical protein